MNNKEKCLVGLTCFLGGVVTGFLISPIKKGMYFGNNCGNQVRSIDELQKINENCKSEIHEEFISENN